MTLTIVIPTHGRPTLLARTLGSVAACERPPGYGGCVVIENGPASGAEAVVAEAAAAHPEAGFRYLHHDRANKSAALNAALESLGGSASGADPADRRKHLVVFFDDDMRMAPGTLRAYAEASLRSEAAFFGGPARSDFEDRPPDWLLPFYPASVKGFGVSDATDEFLGFNWAAFLEDVVRLGGFDPNFGPGSPTGARGQEGEMQNRLKQAGLAPVAVPEAVAWHYVPASRSSRPWLVRRKYLHGIAAAHFDLAGRSRGAVATEAAGTLVRSAGATVTKSLARDPVGRWRALLGASTAAGRLVGAFRGGPPASGT